MKICPICDHGPLGSAMRCPNCTSALTPWRNFDLYAEQAHAAGLHAWPDDRPTALDFFLRAIIFAPEEAAYLSTYGRALAQCRRLDEAVLVLKKTCTLARTSENAAALEAALAAQTAGAAASAPADDDEPTVSPTP